MFTGRAKIQPYLSETHKARCDISRAPEAAIELLTIGRMRLLNTKTLKLEEFYDNWNTPKYYILSHTWDGSSEISLQDWVAGAKTDSTGHAKVLKFAQYAGMYAAYGCEWCWVDTICIDKTSSAELSESINSMFNWYQEAAFCIVYLSDVDMKLGRSRQDTLQHFEASRWFTRGWTLQELLAPIQIEFLDQNWESIGRGPHNTELMKSIVAATKIPERCITFHRELRLASVAQKMSWASGRHTTRTEDMAYCLMGLFEINMPLLYGERDNAFRRLQEEILKVSHDESIFVWELSTRYQSQQSPACLAVDPSCFRNCGHIVNAAQTTRDLQIFGRPTISLANKRLELDACIPNDPQYSTANLHPGDREKISVALNCYQSNMPEYWYCVMELEYDAARYEWSNANLEYWSSPLKYVFVHRDQKSNLIMYQRRVWLRAASDRFYNSASRTVEPAGPGDLPLTRGLLPFGKLR